MMLGIMTNSLIVPVRAFRDNYLWLIIKDQSAAVVDPGDAEPVLAYLRQHRLSLASILITHHHHDHIGGVVELLNQYDVPVYSPPGQMLDFPYLPVADGDRIHLAALSLSLTVIGVPGHTANHVAYYGGNSLFCGDTLFGCGCGRIFDGSCEALHASLAKLAQLPDATRVYCAHEYTLDNINFALSLDPGNAALRARQVADQERIAQGLPTIPSTIALEKATNPFLRCHTSPIQAAAKQAFPNLEESETSIFCAVRQLKNNY
jgi:hydroxyacylglutathione hydrolase